MTWCVAVLALAVSACGAAAAPAMAVRAVPTYRAEVLESPEPAVGAGFGSFMNAVGDVDADGVNDIAVASSPLDGVGRVWVFSGRTRGVIHMIESPDAQAARFGGPLFGIEDASGDGVGDLVIGGGRACCFQGRFYIFSGKTGALIRQVDSPGPQGYELFGCPYGLATGDLDGDGAGDFVITADGETRGCAMATSALDPSRTLPPCRRRVRDQRQDRLHPSPFRRRHARALCHVRDRSAARETSPATGSTRSCSAR